MTTRSAPRRGPQAVLVAACLLSTSAGCSDSSEPSARERCRELEPAVEPAQAWEDIRVLQENMTEYLALDCDQVLRDD